MRITLKTLKGDQLSIELEEAMTISETKAQIQKEYEMPAESLKLVAKGKVLSAQDKTLKDYNIKDGDFLVVMVQKAKPAPKQAEVSVAKQNEEPKQESNAAASGGEQQQEPAREQTATANQSGINEAQVEEAALNLMAISGKNREECLAALSATGGNPDVAFEYLSTGVNPIQVSAARVQSSNLSTQQLANQTSGTSQADPMQQLMSLADNPNFIELRRRILQNPAFYDEFINVLKQTQPQIYETIQQHPQAFMNLILGGGGGAQPAHSHSQGQTQPPPGFVRVNQQQFEAIERLQALGFSQNKAAQAYFACDENEEFAANFLFEQAAEEDQSAFSAAPTHQQQQQNVLSVNQNQENSQSNQPSPSTHQDQQPKNNESNVDESQNNQQDQQESQGDDKKENDEPSSFQ